MARGNEAERDGVKVVQPKLFRGHSSCGQRRININAETSPSPTAANHEKLGECRVTLSIAHWVLRNIFLKVAAYFSILLAWDVVLPT